MTDHPLTAEAAIALDGWHTERARVLLVHNAGPNAVTVIDTHNDEQEIEIQRWCRAGPGDWHVHDTHTGNWPTEPGVFGNGTWPAHSDTPALRYLYGRARRPGRQTIIFAGRHYEITATRSGWWSWLAQLDLTTGHTIERSVDLYAAGEQP